MRPRDKTPSILGLIVIVSVLLALTILLTGCGKEARSEGNKPSNGCSVMATNDGALISCADGSEALVSNGKDGVAGPRGAGCSAESLYNGVRITCGDGSVVEIYNGQDGTDGTTYCYKQTNKKFVRIECPGKEE